MFPCAVSGIGNGRWDGRCVHRPRSINGGGRPGRPACAIRGVNETAVSFPGWEKGCGFVFGREVRVERLDVGLRTLTPLWTGGVDGRSSYLHETGIIGSLRWWYEAIVRGLGGDACDPTARGAARCHDREHCIACDLFGCTGWGRRFRLQLDTGRLAYPQHDKQDILRFKPPGRTTGWFYGAGQLAPEGTDITGQLIVLRDGPHDVENAILVAMQLPAKWGGIGARTQHGYGVAQITAARNGQPVQANPDAFLNHHPPDALYVGPFPALTDFFFARFQFVTNVSTQWWTRTDANGRPLLGANAITVRRWGGGNPGSVSIAPAIKSQLRYGSSAFASRWGSEWYVFGRIGQRYKAKVNVSGAYQENGRWAFRAWGWLPRGRHSFNRASFLDDLHTVLRDPAFWEGVFGTPSLVDLTSVIWREFDSPRDTAGHMTDIGAFLTSLLA